VANPDASMGVCSRFGHLSASRLCVEMPAHLTFTTAFAYVIPIGMIQAITNQQVGLK